MYNVSAHNLNIAPNVSDMVFLSTVLFLWWEERPGRFATITFFYYYYFFFVPIDIIIIRSILVLSSVSHNVANYTPTT
jgi:hypothetical protein